VSTVLDPSVGRVLIVGLGRVTGAAAVEALLELGVQVRVAEANVTEEHLRTGDSMRRAGVEVMFGEPDPDLVDWADLIIPSPGVPPANPLLARASAVGRGVWSEIELGSRFATGPILAVTGTNGKTTTATLLEAILNDAGLPALAAGNIGFPLVRAARSAQPGQRLVVEVSSFQLAFIDSFRPEVAVVLNVAEDHYDWHDGYQDYLSAKARITENQSHDQLLVVAVDDPGCLQIAARSAARIAGFGLSAPEELGERLQQSAGRAAQKVAGVREGRLVVQSSSGELELMKLEDIRLQGLHNIENVQAACLAALECGADPASIAGTVSRFESLPHRTSLVAEINGVRYIDDSKATNPHATLKAMEGLDRVILIAGGRAKGLDLSPLAGVRAALRGVVVTGEAAAQLKELFHGVPCQHAPIVEDAVTMAAGMAQAGDTVLLSPACSSLDQYSDYAERGRRFAEAVKSLC
jgi:UDP-N-acetylmuramoylalanine--D-glutamate ligase